MNFNLFFDKALGLGFSKVQITITDYCSSEVKVSNNEVLYDQACSHIGYTVVALKGNSVYKINTDYLDDSILKLLDEKSTIEEEKKEFTFLDDTSKNNNVDDLKIIDIHEITNKLKSLDSYRDNLVHKINSIYEATTVIKRIINNNGVDISSSRTNHVCSVELINESDEKNTVVFKDKLDTKEIDVDLIVSSLKEELGIKINEESITTGKYNCIIKNNVLNVLLGYIIGGINAERVSEKTTFLEGKLNKKVFSEKLNIKEEPLNKDLPGYTLFDDEGTFTYNKSIITNGVLNTYLYDKKEALKNGCEATGNAYGGISTRNMYVVPGNDNFDELVKKVNNGLIIDECMGYHASVHINNGEISLQAFGMIIRDGKIVSSFKPVVMTTNFIELLSNIEEIGNDLEFPHIGCGCPSILVKDISIASK